MNKIISKVKRGMELTVGEQREMLDLPHAETVLEMYVLKWSLCEEAELKLFELPDELRQKYFCVYISRTCLCRKAELKLFEHLELLKEYIRLWPLCGDEQLKLFDLPEKIRDEFLEIYIRRRFLCDDAEFKLLDLPEKSRDKLVNLYERCQKFCQEAEQLRRKLYPDSDA